MTNIRTGLKMAYLTAFENGEKDTISKIHKMQADGVNVIELLVPFSDPVAETPEIQAASVKALANGCTIERIFNMLETIKQDITAEIILSFYANTAYKYGYEAFCHRASETGVKGLIVEDMPFEERDELKDTANANGLYLVTIIARAGHERLLKLAKGADGLICISPSFNASASKEEFDSALKLICKNATCPIMAKLNCDEKGRYLISVN